ncbi:hypothetical protein MTR_6g086695 [Medicago truncatula]|uniref:Uncharacterized protein n=1 Tax=Medicago truncatula TaxID=3880 RepID=G8A2J1_MEDTR|nr:hypothetical protein MTR_6g086695 [Medicago truncatula]
MRTIKDGDLKDVVHNMVYVDSISKDKWTQTYDEGRLWGHMTSNLVESWNFVFKGTHNLPVTPIVI